MARCWRLQLYMPLSKSTQTIKLQKKRLERHNSMDHIFGALKFTYNVLILARSLLQMLTPCR